MSHSAYPGRTGAAWFSRRSAKPAGFHTSVSWQCPFFSAVDDLVAACADGDIADMHADGLFDIGLDTAQAEAVCELFGGKKKDIKVIGIRHGEKMYETLLTNEECAKAEDMGDFYRVPADNRSLNYEQYFTKGDANRCELSEFNSANTKRLNLEETKAKIASLEYIQNELNGIANLAK